MTKQYYREYDGIFYYDKVRVSGEDLEPALKAHFAGIGKVATIFEWWEGEAMDILESRGYPIKWQELSKVLRNGEHPRQIHDLESMLWHFACVRRAIAENKIEPALWNMALAIQAGMEAKIRPIEPVVDMGEHYGKTQSEKARRPRTRGGMTPAQREARNEAIRRDFQKTRLNVTNFSQKYQSKYGLKARQIRHILKGTLGS